MRALILAAGLGERLGLKDIPKPMYRLKGKPVLEHNILLLKKHNINEVCIAIHYMPQVITDYFNDGSKWQLNIQYSFEDKPLGTAGGVKNAEWFFGKNEPFFILYGDNFTNVNLQEMLQFHLSYKPTATIAVFDPKETINSNIIGGTVALDENNSLLSFTEKKNASLKCDRDFVNAGVYILEPEVLSVIPQGITCDFGSDIFPKLLAEGSVLKGYLTCGFVIAIDTGDALKVAEQVVSHIGDDV